MAAPVIAALEYDDAEARVAEGGWYRRDENYTVYYRPRGHEDEFLTAWLGRFLGDGIEPVQALHDVWPAAAAPVSVFAAYELGWQAHRVRVQVRQQTSDWETPQGAGPGPGAGLRGTP